MNKFIQLLDDVHLSVSVITGSLWMQEIRYL